MYMATGLRSRASFAKQNKPMRKITTLAVVLGSLIYCNSAVFADEIQFMTLPQPVQTTVIRETRIANPSYVTRVVRDDAGIYAVTVRANGGDQIVYVNSEGAIMQAPSTTTRITTVREPVQTQPAEGTVATYDQVQQDLPRYQLLEKKGKKEVYFDRQTGQKVTVKRENK
jgi:hypothetical protein